jgi:L-ascorbate metabolism protein UlaG (beta-lactamase superfamily)
MKITKYPQSCVLIETNGKKILIDTGTLLEGIVEPIEFKDIDMMLLTHRHGDHCFPEYIKIVKENNPNMIILANSEVSSILSEKEIESETVKIGDVKEFDDIKIEVVEAIHGYNVMMEDSGFPKENNGFVIDDGKLRVYHCSDTICFRNEIKADVILVPISGHAVVMEPTVAVEFCQEINPKFVIPIHYDSPKHPRGTEKFEEEIKKTNLKYKILKNKESIKVI